MSVPSLYSVASREVDAVTALLKAVLEVNWHLHSAQATGWVVELSIMEDTGALSVSVSRDDCWPTAASEAEAAVADHPQ